MKKKMATYFRFAPVLALLSVLAAVLWPAGKAGAVLTAITVTINPDTAGAVAEYQVNFTTDRALPGITSDIVLTFDKDIGFPTSISGSSVIVTASALDTGTAGQAVNPPFDPAVAVDTVDTRRRVVTIKVPDMDPGTTGASAGINNIAAGAAVTVIISQGAGLTNPRLAEIFSVGAGRTELFVLTRVGGVSDPAAGAPGTARATITPIPRSITLNRVDGSRGQVVDVTGRGYAAGITAIVFIDVNANGVYDVGVDVALAQVTVAADNTFTAQIIMGGSFAVGNNAINATDGTAGTINVATVARNLRLRGKVSVTPTTAALGDTIAVTLEDFAAGAVVNELNIGGASMLGQLTAANNTIPAGGRLTVTVTVPVATPLGIRELRAGVAAVGAFSADQGRRTTITIRGATVVMSPATAVPNQSITISGSGFTQGGAVTIPANSITIGGVPTVHGVVNVDNGGNWVVSPPLILPINATTLTAGSYVVRATDSGGLVGEGTLTIPGRRLTVSPASSRQGSTITVSGTGFPANNTQLGADNRTVNITYLFTTATATPNASGNFAVTMAVPLAAAIPSDNAVTATIGGFPSASATAIHSVPSGAITVNPNSGVPGTSVTVRGFNFPTFSTLTALTMGGRNVLPSPAPTTNATGSFTAIFTVPQLDIGVHAVITVVAGLSAVTAFEVVEAQTPVAQALAPLGNNLIRAWGLDSLTGSWQVHDPALIAFSDLTGLVRGRGYWIKVTTAQTVTLGTHQYTLSAGWNLIGWLG